MLSNLSSLKSKEAQGPFVRVRFLRVDLVDGKQVGDDSAIKLSSFLCEPAVKSKAPQGPIVARLLNDYKQGVGDGMLVKMSLREHSVNDSPKSLRV